MSTSTSAIFSGTSRYSSDFQQVIARAVQIASLPIAQLQDTVTDLTNQSTELDTLNTKFTALQTAVSDLNTAMGSGGLTATLSDDNTVSANITDGAMEGTYSIEVDNPGAYTTTMTSDSGPAKVTDPSTQTISSQKTPNFTLKVSTLNADGSTSAKSFTIKPTSNTLSNLVNAINADTTANVQATMVNVGSSSAPDYRLSMQSTVLGSITIQLNDGSMNLETQQVAGSVASYKVNGETTAATSSSSTVTIAPGLTVNLLAASADGTPTSITVTRQSQPISDALNEFVTAYNAALTEVNTQRGQAGGPLAGQSILYDLADAMENINNGAAAGTGVNSLAALGISMDQTGQMSFDQMSFLGTELTDSAGVTAYLGAAATGGFLKTATDTLTGVLDPTNGMLGTAISSVKSEITDTNTNIATEQARVDQLQTTLTNQMSQADASIATLEQQYEYMSQMFEAMTTADQQYANGG